MTVGNVANIGYITYPGRTGSPDLQRSTQAASPPDPDTAAKYVSGSLFLSLDGDRAEISDRARGLFALSLYEQISGSGLLDALEPQGACYTCQNRKYVDQSDDASVSFQTPTNINPSMAGAVVASHEQEHVRNEQARAHRDDREIVNQTVTLTYDFCPECGRNYVSGGTTRTTSVSKSDSGNMDFDEASPDEDEQG